jgi:hypothetical protein
MKPGEFCTLGLRVPGVTVVLELDEPVPEGVVLVDGAGAALDGSGEPSRHVVEWGTVLSNAGP